MRLWFRTKIEFTKELVCFKNSTTGLMEECRCHETHVHDADLAQEARWWLSVTRTWCIRCIVSFDPPLIQNKQVERVIGVMKAASGKVLLVGLTSIKTCSPNTKYQAGYRAILSHRKSMSSTCSGDSRQEKRL